MNFKIKIFLSLLLICLLSGFPSFAQSNEQLTLRKINEQNGLSDNDVRCIYKDKNEFVWIGTASGLNLMNGSDITVYKHNSSDSNTVSNNYITAITGTSKGLIWIGTQNGLNLLDPVTNTFTTYPLHAGGKNHNDVIGCLAVDNKDNLFIGTFSGLFFMDHQTKKVTPVHIPANKNELLQNNWITCLTIDSSDILWVTTYNELWKLDTKTHRITPETGAKNNPSFGGTYTCFIIDHSGKIWIGTWESGLKEFDPSTKKLITHQYVGAITDLAEVKHNDNNYLLMINGNLTGFDPVRNTFSHFSSSMDLYNDIKVENLYTSGDNWLWMGTQEGVYFYNPAKAPFRHRRFNTPITNQNVSLLEWNNQILVSGRSKNFLKLYDDSLNEITDYGKKISGFEASCLSLSFAGNEKLKAGTTDGIADINLVTHQVKLDSLSFLAKKFEAGNFITHLIKDKENAWWIFPWRNGIWRSDSAGKKFYRVFRNFITEHGYPKPLVISDAVEDDKNNLWFADLDEGIIYYNRASNKFSKPFVQQLGERNATSQILYYHNRLYSFADEEIFKWDPEKFNFEKIKLPPKMDKPVSSIAFDSIGHLWVATQKGLLVYDIQSKKYERFTTADGLISDNMNGNLYCKKNGTMVFGCPDYLISFKPGKMLAAIKEAPRLMLAEVIADGKSIVFDTSGKMHFPSAINNFVFKWAVTDYNDPVRNHYYYRLEGIDKAWRFAGDRGQAAFANLSPGDYTLLLKGENSNGIPAGNILLLRFKIATPFWSTWWFMGLLALAICFIFYAIYRYRINQILKIERLRNKISLDLHDDIGSTLSSISIMSEIALQHEKESKNHLRLSEIKESSISLMDRMDDIVWSINPNNDSMESLLLRIKTFAAKLFEAREINYSFDVAENMKNVPVQMEYRQHIYLIMKEAINNLVKYSGCTEAEITADYRAPLLRIIIKDNGKGFEATQNIFGNGLSSMKKRAAEMKANFEITSAINKGTTIVLEVKIS